MCAPPRWGRGLPWVVFLLLASCSPDDKPEADPGEEPISADVAYQTMVETEEVISELVVPMNRLKRAVRNMDLTWDARLFKDGASVVDLDESVLSSTSEAPEVRHYSWKLHEQSEEMENLAGGLWSKLWLEVDAFEDARFGVLQGELGEQPGTFVTKLKLSARGRTTSKEQGAWRGKVKVWWEKEGEEWLISRLEVLELNTLIAPTPMFSEVLDRILTSPDDLAKARESIHERYIREVFFTGGTKFAYPKHYWEYITSWDSLDQHTSVSVVDIDGDGWDDFYVTARWGKNQLWRNRGDGTFEEIAEKVGLDLDGVCNCSLFADFDNDGDKDVFIGRSLERGRYFVNVDGSFLERTGDDLDAPLPYWTSSMSTADVNGDGLLDLYISTYRLPISRPRNILSKQFLSPEEQSEWKRRRGMDHPVFRLTGPPNVLLLNQGDGKFSQAPEAGGADLWLNSFQSTWSDYDNDGDPDLFVANDYAPDYVFRNDGGKLTDVTREVAGDELQGFGMGVTLGDYDNDGFQDPYFTYMYSKAGSRITSMFKGLERRMYEGVAGNKLLKNTGKKFEPAGMSVSQAGWSWGGQFSDLNNDGFLDLYVANGLYTPPKGTETEVDL
ncbi:VCBS repeat-containing protein [Akkermansiaceae bacterium]|nr:VCBS repeat-containing protein [Akkermansiaceae bacterium]